MEQQQERLCATSANGFWVKPDDGWKLGFVVYEDAGRKRAFLIRGFLGRPAYTIVDLVGMDSPAQYIGPVMLAVTKGSRVELNHASLGKLVVRNGCGLIVSAHEDGQLCETKIAELLGDVADGAYDYSFQLVGPEGESGGRSTVQVKMAAF